MKRAIGAVLFTITLLVVALGPVAQADQNWNCRDISLKGPGLVKIARTVCYPCSPDLLPDSTPKRIVLLWEQEVCAPAA
jgi:hypothetical protein